MVVAIIQVLYFFKIFLNLIDGSAAKSCFAGNLIDRMADMMGIIILNFMISTLCRAIIDVLKFKRMLKRFNNLIALVIIILFDPQGSGCAKGSVTLNKLTTAAA